MDLGRVHAELREQMLEDIAELLDSSTFINGPQVLAFEQAFAAFAGARRCVGVASGLDALRLALIAAELEPGDEVIVPAQTFVATFEAVVQAGGTPIVVDVSEADYNMDLAAADAATTSRTRVLLPVHLYGQMADMERARSVARRHELTLVEDACQAHGAVRDGHRAGTAGVAGAFSFYPSKNLGAIGDAGVVITDDETLATRVGALRQHGALAAYDHVASGYTARLDSVQAVALLRKLPFLERWNEQRAAAARFYAKQLGDVGDLRLPPVPVGSAPAWHLYVVRTAEAERLASFLAERGVETARHYPEPPHLTRAFSFLGYRRSSFPVAEAIAREGLSLPLFPGISEAEEAAVVDGIRDFFDHGS
jgi:dTDP-4-amino-4,6-dideoxygalactose transaminase